MHQDGFCLRVINEDANDDKYDNDNNDAGDNAEPSCTKMGCRVRLERLRQSR